MDRRLLFPVIAATAWAQQTSPANADAEKALRTRAERFFQLEVDKKFRQVEDFVAADTKDYFYDNGKPDIRSFRIDRVEFTDNGAHAVVYWTATVVMVAPGVGSQQFEVPAQATWKLENGQWVWYVNQNAEVDTPFGKWRPGAAGSTGSGLPSGMANPADAESLVTINRNSVDLSTGRDAITITNHMPGPINLELGADRPHGLTVEIDKAQLAAGEKAVVSFSVEGNAKPTGAVHITALPLHQEFLIQIKAK